MEDPPLVVKFTKIFDNYKTQGKRPQRDEFIGWSKYFSDNGYADDFVATDQELIDAGVSLKGWKRYILDNWMETSDRTNLNPTNQGKNSSFWIL